VIVLPTEGETPSRLPARRQRYIHCRSELAVRIMGEMRSGPPGKGERHVYSKIEFGWRPRARCPCYSRGAILGNLTE